MIPWLHEEIAFPPVSSALIEPSGLLAAGGDLSPERLIAAYRHGIFPWYSAGDPILWWSPDPRMVLRPQALKIARSLARTLRNTAYEVRLDSAFAEVVHACASASRGVKNSGQPGTWITSEMQAAYIRLHKLGYAHSVETWIDGELAGGLYGIALGRAFFGESMFSCIRDASKIALAHLCSHLQALDFGIIDCQMETAHLSSLGACPIPRRDFIAALELLVNENDVPGRWDTTAIDGTFRNGSATAGPLRPKGIPMGQGGAAKKRGAKRTIVTPSHGEGAGG